ncbi:uncharacterized protein LOC104897025 [Beta vulgaris subsp. vulgaris]|uniref:uncharacterized protein LOC104897025 n=1 Tax=Beta vulgaris subsp. vulgaris TaxID=3555 RepID=UPI002549A82F|nr:uncharacterized protein LOC104897025 [Beta vulgaris subsp. vulgaris]
MAVVQEQIKNNMLFLKVNPDPSASNPVPLRRRSHIQADLFVRNPLVINFRLHFSVLPPSLPITSLNWTLSTSHRSSFRRSFAPSSFASVVPPSVVPRSLSHPHSVILAIGSLTLWNSLRESYSIDEYFLLSLFYQHAILGILDEEKRMNSSYIISVARKLGCSIFLLPEDITESSSPISVIAKIDRFEAILLLLNGPYLENGIISPPNS